MAASTTDLVALGRPALKPAVLIPYPDLRVPVARQWPCSYPHAMTRYWPRRADGLPPGQRLLTEMPRFTDLPHLPPPDMPDEPRLEIKHEGEPIAILTGADLQALQPRDHLADFHCVTGWSVKGLIWTGVPLREVLSSIGIHDAPSPYLVARTGDRRKAAFVSEDAVADDVIVATHLNGAPLDGCHGKPLRLVSPSQYGYKSVKHLIAIDFRAQKPKVQSKEHLRARVTLQERHPTLASWVVRLPYRLTIPPTAYLAERSLRRQQVS